MASRYGKQLQISIFGQSHSPAIGVTIDGLPAGFAVDRDKLQAFLDRRAPGQGKHTTARKEADAPEFLSGLVGDVTCGAPLTAIIRNTDTRSQDYDAIRDLPRPGHADYTAHIKYGGHEDAAGGGHFSGRLTAPLCIAGGIALQMLESQGVRVVAEIIEVGGRTENFLETIEEARLAGDSVGGIVSCTVSGLPAGLGDPMFDGMENRIAAAVFAIPAVKALEFGAGLQAARLRGSQNNDAFVMGQDGTVRTSTNHAGGILGGITTGMDLTCRVTFKPTPSIAAAQETISWSRGENASLTIQGRHDPCIVPRAVPVVEAACAIAVLDAWLEDRNWETKKEEPQWD